MQFIKYGAAWWLRVQQQWVGYYPTALYTAAGLRDSAKTIDFGGEIVDNLDPRYGGHPLWHTTTAMGRAPGPRRGGGTLPISGE